MGRNGKVTIALPNVEGAQGGHTESVYQGPMKPHQKECVLIIDHETGQITLERLAQSMIVKKTRANNSSNIANATKLPSSITTTTTTTAASNHAHTEDLNGERVGPSKLSQQANHLSSAKYTTSNGNHKPTGPRHPSALGVNGKKVSPPFAAARQVANGKSTPSPPSMPIFNKGALLHSEPTAATAATTTTKGPTRGQSTTPPNKAAAAAAAVNGAQKGKDLFDGSSSSSASSSSSSDDEMSDTDVCFEKVLKTKKKIKFDKKPKTSPPPSSTNGAGSTAATSNSLSMPSFSALAAAPARPAAASVVVAPVVAEISNGHSTKPSLSSQNKKSTQLLALSEDSDSDSNDDDQDSSDEDFPVKANASLAKLSNGVGGGGDSGKKLTTTITPSNGVDHSMPKFTNDTKAANLSMPKFSTLSM